MVESCGTLEKYIPGPIVDGCIQVRCTIVYYVLRLCWSCFDYWYSDCCGLAKYICTGAVVECFHLRVSELLYQSSG